MSARFCFQKTQNLPELNHVTDCCLWVGELCVLCEDARPGNLCIAWDAHPLPRHLGHDGGNSCHYPGEVDGGACGLVVPCRPGCPGQAAYDLSRGWSYDCPLLSWLEHAWCLFLACKC